MSVNKNATCRLCAAELRHTFVDLGMSPLCESFLSAEQLDEMEPFYPLHVRVCANCFLVQLEQYVSPAQIFTEYAYFSSYSTSWVKHARDYVEMIVRRLGLDARSQVVELASNDGYLLQHFLPHGIPVLGIEPARNVAAVASAKHIPTITKFFGIALAESLRREGRTADLIIGNNVYAQVPDLHGFTQGMKILLAPDGVITLEFPHIVSLIAGNQFDTIYHEHFSYFSLSSARRILLAHDLELFDVEEIPTHGGSLRVYACHRGAPSRPISERVENLLRREVDLGIDRLGYYENFGERVKRTKRRLLSLLISAREAGKSVAGYGAPGKGNTLLNYCGIRQDLLEYTVDRNPYKHGKFLPGTHIPVFPVDRIRLTRPDYLLILPWNLEAEVLDQTAYVRDWGGRHVVPIPEPKVCE